MNDTQQSTSDRIARLRQRFLEQLPQRLTEGQRLFASLQNEPHDPATLSALHLFFHNLKGTSSSFGFQQLAQIAAPGYDMAKRLLMAKPELFPEHWQETIANCLAALNRESQQLLELSSSSQASL